MGRSRREEKIRNNFSALKYPKTRERSWWFTRVQQAYDYLAARNWRAHKSLRKELVHGFSHEIRNDIPR